MNFLMFCGSLVTDQIFISHKKWETFNGKWEGTVTATNGFFVYWKCFERSRVRAQSLGWSILRTISSCQAEMTPGQMLPHLNNLFTSRRVLIKSLTMWQDLMNALTDGLWNISCAEFRNIYQQHSPFRRLPGDTKSEGGPSGGSQYGSSHSQLNPSPRPGVETGETTS